MPTARGWRPGQTPVAAAGLKVGAFASGLQHPRWLLVLPRGDVLVAEATEMNRSAKSVFGYAMVSTMRRVAAMGESADRITLLRDTDGDGVAETQGVFMEGLNQPFGMAALGSNFYVDNTDGVAAFPYAEGASRITAPGRKLINLKPGGHWTRSLLPSPDGQKLYVGVGSLSDIGDDGFEAARVVEPQQAERLQARLCAVRGWTSGPPRDVLSGFLSSDERVSYGRPVGVALGADHHSLLMADDVGNVIWRVTEDSPA